MTSNANATRERVRRRRRSTGGTSDRTTEARSPNPDNDEEVVDLDLDAAIVAQAQQGQPFRPPAEGAMDFTPQNRMKDVKKRSGKYEKEYRLQLLHRMLMRRVPLDEIARELDVSVSTIMRDRQVLYDRLRTEAKKLDINQMVGDTMGFFSEIQGMALRAASIKKSPVNLRLAAMRTALSSRNDQHKFLEKAGVFDVLRYRMSEEDSAGDMEKLMNLTQQIIGAEDDEIHHIEELKAEFPELGLEDGLDEEEDEHIDMRLF
jgi:hypothetical protein